MARTIKRKWIERGQKPEDPIIKGCLKGDLELVKKGVGEGKSVKQKWYDGFTCLLLAVEKGYLDIIEYLLENGSTFDEKNSCGENCLQVAIRFSRNKIELVKFLVDKGCSPKQDAPFTDSPLLTAARYGNPELIQYLLDNGCSLEEKDSEKGSCIIQASKAGNIPMIEWLINEKGFSLQETNFLGTCITNAAYCEEIDAVVWMLRNGSSIDETAQTPGSKIRSLGCKGILQHNGLYWKVKKNFKTKSSLSSSATEDNNSDDHTKVEKYDEEEDIINNDIEPSFQSEDSRDKRLSRRPKEDSPPPAKKQKTTNVSEDD